ncbi:PQQ-binding-like beta-propeller repeat protein [Ruminiclostridium cellobioparum]|uniref:PQQ enzyme repeat-containing protein n=1 Tax=Ruminiclostridium cellobioparum subsp. termitidis CT1112 TaxID=1195236 RepID=S0FST9_RUMCE|nr:PQQ-binding-like beta-propeller repeat protein [Ruminiclostridium cellobioparum]EMS71593.1 PQQ enzyme repeat-containing protein [Ruminiclostridium cellobioparum subsp. termitidis CT1112]
MKRYRRRATNRLRALLTILVLALIMTGVWIGLSKVFNLDSDTVKTSSNSSAGVNSADSTGEIEEGPEEEPVADPMPQEMTDPEKLKSSWTEESDFGGKKAYPDFAIDNTFASGLDMKSWIFRINTPLKQYTPRKKDKISFGSPEEYSELEGVTTFRGNNYRDSASFGTRTVSQKKLEIVWEKDGLGAISAHNSYWPGTGWTGQPLLVHWPENTRKMMNINGEMKSKDLVEVIYPALDGNIYFLDLETGKPTREKIQVGYPIKGTGMIDPRGYPVLYTGMGINENSGKFTEYKFRIINLLNQKELYSIFGRDEVAFRGWGANDASALLDRKTDTLLNVGENGLVYRVKLNTKFDKSAGTLSIAPQLTKYRYRSPFNDEQGIENSPAIYKNYMYFCDNGGTLQCLDLNTMKPVWIYDAKDDTDASIVIEETKEGVFLYTANQVDKRGENGKAAVADCNIRKLNALTGELIWQKNYQCVYNYYINGGALGTPVIGKDDISNMVIFNICFTGSNSDGTMVALDKKTGEEIWKKKLTSYSWCSPLDFKSSDGKTYMVYSDFAGFMHLVDPMNGKTLDSVSLQGNVESSPAIYNDTIVVGSYARKIFGIKVK